MGYLFANIGQLAGFLANNQADPKGAAKPIAPNEAAPFDFEAFMKSLVAPDIPINPDAAEIMISPKSETPCGSPLSGNQLNNFGVLDLFPLASNSRSLETKEIASVDSNVLRIKLSSHKDTISILISPAQARRLMSEFPAPKALTSPARIDARLQDCTNAALYDPGIIYGDAPVTLSFDISSLFMPLEQSTQEGVPVSIFKQAGTGFNASVKVVALTELLAEYPDQIAIEIANMPGLIQAPRDKPLPLPNNAIESNFKFDLRDLAKLNQVQESTPIKGVLTVLEQSTQPLDLIREFPQIVFSKTDTSQRLGTGSHNSSASRGASSFVEGIRVITGEGESTQPVLKQQEEPQTTVKTHAPDTRKANQSAISSRLPEITEKPDAIPAGPSIFAPAKGKSAILPQRNPEPTPCMKTSGNKQSPAGVEPRAAGDHANHAISPRLTIQHSGSPVISNDAVPKADIVRPEIEQIDNPRSNMLHTVEDLKAAILSAVGRQATSVKLRLYPENLGHMQIRMLWKADGLSLSLKADNQEAAKILNSNIASLKNSLENASLRILDVKILVEPVQESGDPNIANYVMSGESRSNARQQKGEAARWLSKGSRQINALLDAQPVNHSSISNSRGWIDLKA